jgi:DNA replication protein DnaC
LGSPAEAALPSVCPLAVCDGSGWILGPEDVARPCDCREGRVARARSRGIASVIPPKYRGVSFDRPPVTQIDRKLVARLEAFCQDLESNLEQGRGLWLEGDAGTGKTTLAMLVSKMALDAGSSVAIYSVPRLLSQFRRTYDAAPGEQSYLDLFERLSAVDLLHLDDLGSENRTEWVLEQLYALVNERYESQRSLLVTTNLTTAKLEEQVGVRTVSRLTEMCDYLQLYGRDRRVVAAVPDPGETTLGTGGSSTLGSLDH